MSASVDHPRTLDEELERLAGGTVDVPVRPGRVIFRRAIRNRRTQLGLVLFVVVLLLALVGPLVAPHAPEDLVGPPLRGPSGDYLLGTDRVGHDVLSRVLNGGLTVVWMSVAAATLGMILGVTIGLAAAYARNWFDGFLMRVMDVILAFPYVVLVLLFVSILGAKPWLIVVTIAVAWMPAVARVTRGAALEVVEREFVAAGEVIGMPRRRILFQEILPNITTPLMVEYGLRIVWSIGTVATVSFLGLGIQPPAADWGLMINENRVSITIQPWAVIAPMLCIALLALGANLIAEGLGRAIAGIDSKDKGA